MPLWSLSEEKISELQNEKDKAKEKYQVLEAKTEKQMWKDDLNEFLEKYEALQVKEIGEMNKAYLKVAEKGRITSMCLVGEGTGVAIAPKIK